MTVIGAKRKLSLLRRAAFANSKSAVAGSFSKFQQINVFHHIIVHFVVRLICCARWWWQSSIWKYVRNNSLGRVPAIFPKLSSNRTILVVLHFLTNRRLGLWICGFECNYIAPLLQFIPFEGEGGREYHHRTRIHSKPQELTHFHW